MGRSPKDEVFERILPLLSDPGDSVVSKPVVKIPG